jgi:hypothetical protein
MVCLTMLLLRRKLRPQTCISVVARRVKAVGRV